VFVLTLGRLPLGGLYALLFGMGLVGAAFVLTWPLGREVNPPELAGIAVAAVNLGGFVGAAVTQGPLGAILDAHWAGVTLAGARVYPVEAYRASFGASAILVLCACLVSLFFRETRGENVYVDARRRPLA
jgi:MFS family permease